MPDKHPNSERIGGPGAAHENRKHPERSRSRAASASRTHVATSAPASPAAAENATPITRTIPA